MLGFEFFRQCVGIARKQPDIGTDGHKQVAPVYVAPRLLLIAGQNAGRLADRPETFHRILHCLLNIRVLGVAKMAQRSGEIGGPDEDAVDSIDPNTYVIFLGDNGTESDSVDNLYLTASGRAKGTVYESGAHVALSIRGPGITAGSRSGAVVHAVDLYATILDMAGVPVPATNLSRTGAVVSLDSKSLLPVLQGASTSVRDANEGYVLTETSYLGNKAAARNDRYKVVCNSGTITNCGFYDLVADPLEAYPLTKPASCSAYRTTWTTANAQWHYCRLIEAIGNASGF